MLASCLYEGTTEQSFRTIGPHPARELAIDLVARGCGRASGSVIPSSLGAMAAGRAKHNLPRVRMRGIGRAHLAPTADARRRPAPLAERRKSERLRSLSAVRPETLSGGTAPFKTARPARWGRRRQRYMPSQLSCLRISKPLPLLCPACAYTSDNHRKTREGHRSATPQ